AFHGQCGGEGCTGGGFTDSAFAGGDNNNLCQSRISLQNKCGRQYLSNAVDVQAAVLQADGNGLLAQFVGFFKQPVLTGNGYQFGIELLADNDGVFIAFNPGQRPAAQGTVNMNITGGQYFGTGADHAKQHQITIVIQLLPGTHIAAVNFDLTWRTVGYRRIAAALATTKVGQL